MEFSVVKDSLPERWESPLVDLIYCQLDSIGSQKTRSQVERILPEVLSTDKRTRFFLLHQGETLLGFAFGNICTGLESGGNYLWINELHIGQQNRKKGLGTMLVENIQNWCRNHGLKYIAMMTSKKNIQARDLYAKCGFDQSEVIWVDQTL